jgi:CDP-diacylglycerol--glycerol-3-phosphate 3-phosphatidyltransferase
MLRAMATRRNARAWWRYIPNGISVARIGAALFLLTAALEQNRKYFQWLLVACMLSDILDGWIARTFDWTSRLGASLDSTGDILVQLIAIGGLWIFCKDTIVAHQVPVLIVLSLYLAEAVIAVYRYGRISSFHTFFVRVAASALGIFVLSLFFWRYVDWIFYPAISLGVLAYSEELLILLLLAEWTPNVGGLYQAWIIAKRRDYGGLQPTAAASSEPESS